MFRVTILEPFVKNLKAGRFPAVIRIQTGQKGGRQAAAGRSSVPGIVRVHPEFLSEASSEIARRREADAEGYLLDGAVRRLEQTAGLLQTGLADEFIRRKPCQCFYFTVQLHPA